MRHAFRAFCRLTGAIRGHRPRRWTRPPDDPADGRPRITHALFLGGIFPPSDEIAGLSFPTSKTRESFLPHLEEE